MTHLESLIDTIVEGLIIKADPDEMLFTSYADLKTLRHELAEEIQAAIDDWVQVTTRVIETRLQALRKCWCSCHVRRDEFGNDYGLPHPGHDTKGCDCT